MIIGACGFGETGSSVVTDYLHEFDDVQVKDNFEFTYVSGVNGLAYLERSIMNPINRTGDSIYAIEYFSRRVSNMKHIYKKYGLTAERFQQSADDFVQAITMAKWHWQSMYPKSSNFLINFIARVIRSKYIPYWERKHGKRYTKWPLSEVRLSVCPGNFYEAARKHVNDILSGLGLDTNGIIALDQPFPGNNPQACFPFFDDPYAVVVDRDPRDLYVFGKTKLMGKMHFFPIDRVEDFITYYRCLRKGQPYMQENPRILRLQFEDMVYDYDKTTAILREFLHLPENPHPKSVFDPSLSIANTQVFKRFPQFADDVKKIEEALPDYLFDFSKYPEPDFSKKMFFGRSPKHKLFYTAFGQEGYVPHSK